MFRRKDLVKFTAAFDIFVNFKGTYAVMGTVRMPEVTDDTLYTIQNVDTGTYFNAWESELVYA